MGISAWNWSRETTQFSASCDSIADNMFMFLFFPMVSGQNYPGALCNVTYSLPVSCSEVTSKIVAQIDLWNEDKACPGRCEERNSLTPQRGPPLQPVLLQGTGEECTKCPCGQQCLYVARGVEDNVILASHVTPVIRYKDDLVFRLTEREDGSCEVFGHSHSTGPAYYDFTTNYCNLRNLMTGSGLADLDGYRLKMLMLMLMLMLIILLLQRGLEHLLVHAVRQDQSIWKLQQILKKENIKIYFDITSIETIS